LSRRRKMPLVENRPAFAGKLRGRKSVGGSFLVKPAVWRVGAGKRRGGRWGGCWRRRKRRCFTVKIGKREDVVIGGGRNRGQGRREAETAGVLTVKSTIGQGRGKRSSRRKTPLVENHRRFAVEIAEPYLRPQTAPRGSWETISQPGRTKIAPLAAAESQSAGRVMNLPVFRRQKRRWNQRPSRRPPRGVKILQKSFRTAALSAYKAGWRQFFSRRPPGGSSRV
jgi:hypothetical protein